MKIHIKSLCILLSGLIVINMMCFGNVVFAAAAPYVPGVGIPLGQLTPNDKNLWDQFSENFCKAFFGLNNGKSDYENYLELNEAVTAASDECIEAVPQEDGTIDFNYIEPDDGAAVTGGLPYVIPKEISESDFHIDSEGNASINSADYQQAINNVFQHCCLDPIQIGLDIISGKPQNVVTVQQDKYISVFDTLGLSYTAYSSLADVKFRHNVIGTDYNPDSPTYYKAKSKTLNPYFITSDNKLYVMYRCVSFGFSNYSNQNEFYPIFYYSKPYASIPQGSNGRFGFNFFEINGHLYFCYFKASPSGNKISYNQYTFGNPALENSSLLFSDYSIGLESSLPLSPSFINEGLSSSDGLAFRSAKTSENIWIRNDEILSADIICAGYFISDTNLYNSSTLDSAAQMLLATDNPVIGGSSTTNSELSDLQKAIYILAQQQGTTYDEMLSKMDMIIDSSGAMSIVGLDGLEYSVSDLSNKFDEIIGVTAEINQELSKTLEYLKSLNLDELNGYIQSLEGTLNDLNERDKDKSAVLGDCLGSLNDLRDILNESDLSGVSSHVASIDNAISLAQEREAAESEFAEEMLALGLRYGKGTYKLYDQCKFLLDNLFNYNDRNSPPNFQFYYDSNGDGESEIYNVLDLSFLENTLTNENMVDKSWWSTPIKIIDLIRYIIAAVCYGLFVMRLIKRLPTFYGNGPLSMFG